MPRINSSCTRDRARDRKRRRDRFGYLTLRWGIAQQRATLRAKAGRDQFPEISASIDRFVAEARALGAPVELLVHPTGPHGFDTWRGNKRAQSIMRRTLAFFREHLAASP